MRLPRVLFHLVATAIALSACSDRFVARQLNAQFSDQMHDCVPLGWNPVRVDDRFFYPGFSAELDETYWYLPPPWAAALDPQARSRSQGRTAGDLLDHLVRAGLVGATRSHGSVLYNLTSNGLDSFFDADDFGDNPLHEPYVCYTRIVPQRILWKQPAHAERDPYGPGEVQVFRVAFTWVAVPVAGWTPDAYVRAHSVVLGPEKSPAIGKFVLRDDRWYLEGIEDARRDHVADPSVWPSPAM